MAGDPANADHWTEADVYVGSLVAATPADEDTPFSADWDLVGLLDGDAGFEHTREEDQTDRFAWGGILVRTLRRNFKYTVAFTPLEYNATTRSLLWPGSGPGELIVPRPARIKIAFETREGTAVRRLISSYQAEVAVNGSYSETESDVTVYPLIATIFPDADGVLFDEQPNPAS
jgi:hypothetical protein